MGSDLWILDFALEGWKAGGVFASKPRREDALVEARKGQKREQCRDRDLGRGRDLALYLRRKYRGLRLKALEEWVGGLDHPTVS